MTTKLTVELDKADLEIILEALDWYEADRYECADDTTDEQDRKDNENEANFARYLFAKLSACQRSGGGHAWDRSACEGVECFCHDASVTAAFACSACGCRPVLGE